MKKTLLATAIAGALGVTAAAQAATVYDQDGTQVDIYGRIGMAFEGGGTEYDGGRKTDNGTDFVDVGSRLGLILQHRVSDDLTAFGHLEWRFRAQDGSAEPFHETRQSYFGLRSNRWGSLQAGNFNSFYFQAVTKLFDVDVKRGFALSGHSVHSRGDSIGYISPNMNGFQLFLQAKHYSERGEGLREDGTRSERDEEIVAQGGVVYETGGLRLAAGFVDDKAILDSDGSLSSNGRSSNGNDEVRYGATASYQFAPEFSARLGYETRDQNDDFGPGNGFDRTGVGVSYLVNQWALHADIYDIDPDNAKSRTAWSLGMIYDVTHSLELFVDLYDSDVDEKEAGVQIDKDDIYWAAGARYFF